jgi:1,4-alpha-glucan branching enzyme
MLYLDYSRPQGGWIANKLGGARESPSDRLPATPNSEIFSRFPDATTAAEESTAWPMVSRPVEQRKPRKHLGMSGCACRAEAGNRHPVR